MDISLPTLRSPTDVLAVVPYVLGFAPEQSLVVMALRARRMVFQARADLVPPEEIAESVDHLATVIARQRVDAALLIGYGSDATVTPHALGLSAALADRGIQILEALRADGGRYWSYVCTRADCCDPDGTPYDVSTSAVAAQATYAGLSPVASREVLVARLAAPQGLARLTARESALRADARLHSVLDELADERHRRAGEERDEGRRLDRSRPGRRRLALDEAHNELTAIRADLAAIGTEAVDRLVMRHRFGTPLDDDEIAWVGTLLAHHPTRDYAVERASADPAHHVDLWTEVVRRIDVTLAAAPATLLAFAAWQHGDGAVATIALERARAIDPGYVLAQLLTHAIDNGLPPSRWDEVADSVDGDPDRSRRRSGHRSRRRHRSSA